MSLIVQKFGGTSVGTPERIARVAQRIVAAKQAGNDVVTVVSAMGHTTDELVQLAAQIAPDARKRHPRELDMLLTAGERIAMALVAMAVREQGVEALSFTGSQAAIITDELHTGAHIQEIRADRVREELAQGRVVIVAGFQGVSRKREITTLGRGGSDTTAVALAVALGAERCDIYTDVDGVFTADPRRVPAARRLDWIDSGEMVELASAGAQVMHPRAVEIGARYGMPIRVLSSFRDDGGVGTLITRRDPMQPMEGMVLTGLASDRGYARMTIRGLPASMEAETRVLEAFGAAGVNLDMVTVFEQADGLRQLELTLKEEGVPEAEAVARAVVAELHASDVAVRRGLTRIALVGSGMHDRSGVYAQEFRALQRAGVIVHTVSSSAISIQVLVDASQEDIALNALHDAFELAAVPGSVQ
jgi:aspartate kinase